MAFFQILWACRASKSSLHTELHGIGLQEGRSHKQKGVIKQKPTLNTTSRYVLTGMKRHSAHTTSKALNEFHSQLRWGRAAGDGVCGGVELQRRGRRVEAVPVLALTGRGLQIHVAVRLGQESLDPVALLLPPAHFWPVDLIVLFGAWGVLSSPDTDSILCLHHLQR